MTQAKLITPLGMLGYSYAQGSFLAGLERKPDFIGVDGGSTDPGPYYLGAGTSFTSRGAVKEDLRGMILGGRRLRVPVVVGTCGGAGGEPHLQWVRSIAQEIAREEDIHFKMALIHSEQPKEYLKGKLAQGKVNPLSQARQLTEAVIDRSTRIVGMMGVEPYMEAYKNGADVVLAGRSDDAAIFASYGIAQGYPPAVCWTAGKLLECGAACAVPRHKFGHEGILVTLNDDHLLVEPLHPQLRCTPLSIAAFFLHENETPKYHIEPSGVLDLSDCRFDALNDRATRVWGAKWKPAERYTIKLEGVELAGYRCITIGGVRDPILIAHLDDFLGRIRQLTAEKAAAMGISPEVYHLLFRVYGRDGVMGPREPVKQITSHELGIVVEVVAPTQEQANEVLALARILFKNGFFEGKLCDEGTVAFPYAPSDIHMGPVFRFSVWHVVEPVDPLEMFPIEYISV